MDKALAGRRCTLVLAGATAVWVLAACGGVTAAKPVAATGFPAYLACLNQHGVRLPSRAPGPRPSFTGPRPSRSPGSDGRGLGGGGFGGGFGGGGGGGGGFAGDPNNPPPGVDAATWSAALTACQPLRPAPGPGFANSAFAAYRNCLSAHGVTFSRGPGGLGTADPKVAAALATCAPLRPTGRPGVQPSPTR